MHNKKVLMFLGFLSLLALYGCAGKTKNSANYKLKEVHPVNGRQGICTENGYYWVSGSTTLSKYDSNWNLVAENKNPFEGYTLDVNHIGDIDVYNNELYLGVEYFMDGEGKNIQVAVYDGDTLKLKRVFPFNAETGQLECRALPTMTETSMSPAMTAMRKRMHRTICTGLRFQTINRQARSL